MQMCLIVLALKLVECAVLIGCSSFFFVCAMYFCLVSISCGSKMIHRDVWIHQLKQVFVLLANVPTAAGLQDCVRFIDRSLSVDTGLLTGDEKRPQQNTYQFGVFFFLVHFVYCNKSTFTTTKVEIQLLMKNHIQ